jgi:hypothetical protein
MHLLLGTDVVNKKLDVAVTLELLHVNVIVKNTPEVGTVEIIDMTLHQVLCEMFNGCFIQLESAIPVIATVRNDRHQLILCDVNQFCSDGEFSDFLGFQVAPILGPLLEIVFVFKDEAHIDALLPVHMVSMLWH